MPRDEDNTKSVIKNCFSKALIFIFMFLNAPVMAQFSNGSLDLDFNPIVEGVVRAVIEQSDGKIVIGGDFLEVQGVARENIARLNKDGSLDLSFNASINNNTNFSTTSFGAVNTIFQTLDGKLLVGGGFDSVNNTPRNNIAKLNLDGSVDLDFVASTDLNIVRVIVQQSDGQILLGGKFTEVNGETRQNIARLNPDGTMSLGFNSPSMASDTVISIVQQADKKLLIGGFFVSFLGKPYPRITRLNLDGTLDDSFTPKNDKEVLVRSLLEAEDGAIFVGGTSRNSESNANVLQKLTADGSLDESFSLDAGINTDVRSIRLQSDGKILVAGEFNGVASVKRINSDGSLDASFSSDVKAETGDEFLSIALLTSNNIVLAGDYSKINSTLRNSLAKLRVDFSASKLTVSQNQIDLINLQWMTVKGAKVYQVYKCSSNEPICTESFTTKEANYNDRNVVRGKNYFYTVFACSDRGVNCQKVSETQLGRSSIVDAYENDDSKEQAKLVTKSVSQIRSFHNPGDSDWVKLDIKETQKVKLTTGPSNANTRTDTVLVLFDSKLNEIAISDDIVRIDNLFSKIERTLKPGTYYLHAYQYEKYDAIYKPIHNYSLNIEFKKKFSIVPVLGLLLDDVVER